MGNLVKQPDLAERALPMTPPPIPDHQRREEREFWAAFMAARPVILGALCDILAGGLRRLRDVKLDRLPRRADFARWGAACAPGWGSDPSEFVRDYEENRTDAAAAEAAPLLPAIEAVLTRTGLDVTGLDGTASELLDRLGEVCLPMHRNLAVPWTRSLRYSARAALSSRATETPTGSAPAE
jgi:hypothetical protein